MSNAILDAIAARRSVRAYTKEQVSQQDLAAILSAALAAPSARNLQPWHLTAVQDEAVIARVNEAFRQEMLRVAPETDRPRYEDPARSVFHHAPAVIFISSPPTEQMAYAPIDAGIVAQTIALAAQGLGLGSVILGMPRFAFAGGDAAALRQLLQFPQGYDFTLAVSIGHADAASPPPHPIAPGLTTMIP